MLMLQNIIEENFYIGSTIKFDILINVLKTYDLLIHHLYRMPQNEEREKK